MNNEEFYMAGENPMVLPDYNISYNEHDDEYYAYWEDFYWEQLKDKSMGL